MVFDMEGINISYLWKPGGLWDCILDWHHYFHSFLLSCLCVQSPPAIDCFIDILKMFEANYPETLKIVFITNGKSSETESELTINNPPDFTRLNSFLTFPAPRIFPILFNLVKPFLSEDTKKKIRILGSEYSFMPFRFQLISASNTCITSSKYFCFRQLEGGCDERDWCRYFPRTLGRECDRPRWGPFLQVKGDQMCMSGFPWEFSILPVYGFQICLGGQIPEKYYLKNITDNIDMSNFTTEDIGRGSSLKLEYPVSKPGSMIRYETFDRPTWQRHYLKICSPDSFLSVFPI